MWTWQNDDLTFIVHSDNRGFKTIKDNFSNARLTGRAGLPNATLQHDMFACHFNREVMHHQICMFHLLLDLQYINDCMLNASGPQR